MQIETSRFGTIDIEEQDVLSLPQGMIGLPDSTRFIFVTHKEGSPFFWLQSLDDPGLAFVLMDPLLLVPDYELNLSPEDLGRLEVETAGNGIMAWAVVNISRQASLEITANLLAPLVINTRKRIGLQVVQLESPYEIRHPVPLK